MEHERTFLGLFWGLFGLGVAMRVTGAGDLGDVLMVLGLIALIPYGVVFGILMESDEILRHHDKPRDDGRR